MGEPTPTEGRMRAGAFRDNDVLPYAGIRSERLTKGQRRLLLDLIRICVGIPPSGHAELRLQEIEAHLNATHFVWIGAIDDRSPFFYTVQSPVLLIEFDHHTDLLRPHDEQHHHTSVTGPR